MKDELVKTKINGLGQIAHVFGIPNKTGLLFVHGGPGNPNRHKIRGLLSCISKESRLFNRKLCRRHPRLGEADKKTLLIGKTHIGRRIMGIGNLRFVFSQSQRAFRCLLRLWAVRQLKGKRHLAMRRIKQASRRRESRA